MENLITGTEAEQKVEDGDEDDSALFPAAWRPTFSRSNSTATSRMPASGHGQPVLSRSSSPPHPSHTSATAPRPPSPAPDAIPARLRPFSQSVPILNSIMLLFFFWSSADRSTTPVSQQGSSHDNERYRDRAEEEDGPPIDVGIPGSWRAAQ